MRDEPPNSVAAVLEYSAGASGPPCSSDSGGPAVIEVYPLIGVTATDPTAHIGTPITLCFVNFPSNPGRAAIEFPEGDTVEFTVRKNILFQALPGDLAGRYIVEGSGGNRLADGVVDGDPSGTFEVTSSVGATATFEVRRGDRFTLYSLGSADTALNRKPLYLGVVGATPSAPLALALYGRGDALSEYEFRTIVQVETNSQGEALLQMPNEFAGEPCFLAVVEPQTALAEGYIDDSLVQEFCIG
jgi:hypothetical protein